MKESQARIAKCLALTAMLAFQASAQTPPITVLTVEMENVVQYDESFANLPKNGTSTVMEAPITAPATFFPTTFLADIVTVNGKKSKGTTVARGYWVGLNPNPSGSQAVADVTRFLTLDIELEMLQADGTALGTLVLTGVAGGAPPLSAPKTGVAGNFSVIGGTGAFLGARGQAVTIQQTARHTSTLENPINRRAFPAGLWKLAIQIIPMKTPEVVTNNGVPVIVHADDYSQVTTTKPARAGELLIMLASGLGPTRPGVELGQVFTASPLQVTSSPIEVLVNGNPGEVLYAGGYPNTVDNYQVNIRIPSETIPGMAVLQLKAAWVAGAEVKIPVQ